ncbi:MAG: hypothetical protein ACXVZW_08065 [Gaiellaceae bacterium]
MTASPISRLIRYATVEKPRFDAGSVLLYVGVYVLVGSLVGMIGEIDSGHGDGLAFVWALVTLAVLLGLMAGFYAFREAVAGGLLAAAVASFTPAWMVTLERWAGVWSRDDHPFHEHLRWSWLAVELVTVGVSLVLLVATRFPLIGLPLALSLWYLLTDGSVALFLGSSATNDAKAEVTIVIGLLMMGAGILADGTRFRLPAFWLHVVGVGSFAGGLVELWRDSNAGWAGIMLVSLLGVALSVLLRRAAYAVYAVAGLLYGAVHFLDKWIRSGFEVSSSGAGGTGTWKPWLGYALIGLALMIVGIGAAWGRQLRGRRLQTAAQEPPPAQSPPPAQEPPPSQEPPPAGQAV